MVELSAKGPKFEKRKGVGVIYLEHSPLRRVFERAPCNCLGIVENLAKYGM